MKVSRKKIGIYVSIMIIILYAIMPWVTRFVSTFFTTYLYAGLVGGVFVYVWIIKGKQQFLSNFYLVLPFLIWRFFMLFSAQDFFAWFYASLLELLPVLLGIYILNYLFSYIIISHTYHYSFFYIHC